MKRECVERAREEISRILNCMNGPQFPGRAGAIRKTAEQAMTEMNAALAPPDWLYPLRVVLRFIFGLGRRIWA